MHSNSTVSEQYLHQTSILRSSPVKDPYNYTLNDELSRKSMINKLPTGTTANLAQYPQVVILFQAAEIERLSNMISSQRLLNKGHAKQSLDRHSYQIQIKQLSGMLDEAKEAKAKQDSKIQQLNKVIKQLQSRVSNTDISTLSNKYERALLEIGKMYDDNTKLQEQVNSLRAELIQDKKQQGNSQQKNTIRKLKQQIATLEYANSQAAAELRQSLTKQMDEYKIRMEEKTILKKEQLEQEVATHLKNIIKLNAQLQKEKAEKWELQTKQRQYEIKIREYEAKIRMKEADQTNLIDQINTLNARLLTGSTHNQAYSSLSYSYSINRESKAGEPSVNSSFNNLGNTNMHRSVQLENNVALLSQQLERLTELLKNKNTLINQLQQHLSQVREAKQRQIMGIRMKYEADIRKEVQNRAEEKERLISQVDKYKNRIREHEQTTMQTRNGLQAQIIKIKEQQRKICQAVFNRKVETLEMEYGRDRDQLIRLNKMLTQLNEELDVLHSRQAQLKAEKNSDSIRFSAQIQEQEKRYEFRLKSLEEQMRKETERRVNQIKEKDREEYQQLQKQLKQQTEYLRERELESLQRVRTINQQYDSNMAIVQREGNMKMESYRQQLNEERKQLNDLIKDKDRQIGRLNGVVKQRENQIFQMSSLLRQKDRQIAKLNGLLKQGQKQIDSANNLIRQKQRQRFQHTTVIREKEMQIERKDALVQQKERQIRHLKEIMESNNNESVEQAQKQYQLLNKKLDYLSQQTNSAKATIIESLSSTPNPRQTQLLRINSTLEFLSSQITNISQQIGESQSKKGQKQSGTSGNFYSLQYVKQLQSQCDNYLSIINGNLSNSDSVMKRIWQEIQANNRYYRQEQEKWRQAFVKQEEALERHYEQKYKWEQTRYENERLKHVNETLQHELEEIEQKCSKLQAQKLQLASTNKNLQSKSSQTISALQKQLAQNQQKIRQNSFQLSQRNSQQNQQISRLTQIIQIKSKELLDLSTAVAEYQKRYDGLRDQFKGMEEVVAKVLQDRQADFSAMDRLEIQNTQLKREIKKTNQQLTMERNQKSKIIDRSRQHLAKLTQQLLSQTPTITYSIPAHQDFSQTTKMLSLQSQFSRLEQTIHRLKKENYQLTKQNYDESTEEYVNKEFAYIKIVELNKEAERLMQQNIELKDQIERCRLQFTGQVNGEIRQQENLGLMVMLFAEVESLRARMNQLHFRPF